MDSSAQELAADAAAPRGMSEEPRPRIAAPQEERVNDVEAFD